MTAPTPNIALQRGKGVWLVYIYWPDTKTRTRPSLGVPLDQDPAPAFHEWKQNILPHVIHEHHAAIAAASAETNENPTLESVARWFTETHLPFEDRADKTIAHYQRILRDFLGYCRAHHVGRVQQVSWKLIQEWQLWMVPRRRETGNTDTARRDELRALRYVFDQAADAKLIPERLNIGWKIPGKSKDSGFAALSLQDTRTFFDALQRHAAAIYDPTWWMYLTGWLPSDTLDLRLSDIHPQTQSIDRTRIKTGAPMAYPITPEIDQIIQRNRRGRPTDSPEPLFLDPQHRPWDYATYKKRLEYFCKKHHHGKNIRPRDLRKTFATQMARAGENPKILQKLLAHEKVETTLDYYVDVDLPDLHAAANRHLHRFQTTENPPHPCHTTQNPQ